MISTTDMIMRMLLITLLSGLIGFERHVAHRPAGIRTNVLVGVGAALMMTLALSLAAANPIIDPGHLAGQVLTGIGFIGAGIMFRFRGEPHGITTAATIFVVACIGLSIGAGQYALGTTASILALLVLRVVGTMEHKEPLAKHTHD